MNNAKTIASILVIALAICAAFSFANAYSSKNSISFASLDPSTILSLFFNNLTGLSVDVGSPAVNVLNIPLFDAGDERTINITTELNQFTLNCPNAMYNATTGMCKVPIKISIDSTFKKGYLKVSDLSISYQSCAIEEEIIASMLACYERGDYGKGKKYIMCQELTINAQCITGPITEERITSLIQKNELCNVLPNNNIPSIPCGTKQSFNFSIATLQAGSNILIEYSNDTKQVRVS